MVLKPGREPEAKKIFDKWGLDFAVIGITTDTGHLTLKHQGETVADIPLGPLADHAPSYDRPHKPTPKAPFIAPEDVPAPNDLGEALLKLIGGSELSSRRWIYEQYDHTVMGDTIQLPGGDAAAVRVHGTHKALAISTDVTPRYCEADPFEGGKQAVAETWRNLTAVGADPLAYTDCLNFGSPEREGIMGQFVGCIEGMAEASRALAYPVVSGNVSFYNETNGKGIQPTPAIGGVGLVPNIDQMATLAFKDADEVILLIGATKGHLGQSLYLREIAGREEGAPPPVSLGDEKRNGDFVRGLIRAGKVTAVHDCSDGGLAAALADMAMTSGIGATIELPEDLPAHAFLFGEDQARYVVTVKGEDAEAIEASGLPVTRLGVTGGVVLNLGAAATVKVMDLKAAHEGFFQSLMHDQL